MPHRQPPQGDEPEVRRLLHELQVHQVELAQQNEELRAARDALEASLERQVALFAFAPVGLVGLDTGGGIVECNRLAADLLGPGARAGQPLAAALLPDSQATLLRLMADPAGVASGEIVLHGHDDGGLPRTADAHVCRLAAGGMLVALAESTARHRSEQARLAQARAEAASREKSVFLARMSHELRTPLNAVLGFAHLLARDPALAAAAQAGERVSRIADAGQHLLTLVDEVLDLSRLEAGYLALSPEDFDLAALLRDVLAMLSPMAAAQQVALRIDGDGAPVGVHADRTRTRQALVNLVSNAIKYNRRGGEVVLAATGQAQEAAVTVTDNGIGMTPDQQAGLFEPFNRVGAERTAVAGVGLGLTIARQFLLAMQGRLEVSSSPGLGSTFTMVLPRAEGRAMPQPPATPAPAPGGHRLSVLYVEDNPVNAELMPALLEDRPNVAIAIAPDGSTGLAIAQRDRPDLVLLDMQLPDMDGLEFLHHLRSDPATAGIRCVAVSANAMASDVSAALAAGLDGYLTKPVEVEALMDLIDRTAAQAHAARTSAAGNGTA